MKAAKWFLAGMYLHLFFSIVVPAGIVYASGPEGWDGVWLGLLLFYLLMIAVVQIAGWVCVAAAVIAYRNGKAVQLRQGWKGLKLYSIPFYVLNLLYSCLAWSVLIGGSRGAMVFLLPIPILITYLMIFQSGWVGICYIKSLRRQPKNNGKPSGVHYLLQLLPVADVASTILLLRRYPAA